MELWIGIDRFYNNNCVPVKKFNQRMFAMCGRAGSFQASNSVKFLAPHLHKHKRKMHESQPQGNQLITLLATSQKK
jgi:hypothetical protein